MNREKMMKTAKGLYTAAGIIQGFMIAAIIVIVLAGVLMAVGLGDAAIADADVEFGNVRLYLSENYANVTNMTPQSLMLILAGALIIACLVWYGLHVAREILKPMREGEPFTVSVSEKIRRLAWIELVGGIAAGILQLLSENMMNSAEILMGLFKEGAVEHITFNYSFDLTFLVIFFILYLLSYVFSYGEELQQLSDETL